MTIFLGGTRHWRNGSGEGDTPNHSGRNSGRVKVGAAIAVAAVSMGALGVWSATAGAAIAPLPTFPDNINIFPNRDFISVTGFADHAGETALVEVVRPGVGVVGSANVVISGADVAFEVNHPGGYCWGNGTNLKVTPDILGGDEVTMNFNGGPVEYSATTNSTTVTIDSYLDPADPNGTTMKVEGYIEPTTPDDRFEQRIIEPGLRDTEVARRDIRALIGPMVADANSSYLSGAVRTAPDHWVATYVFQNASTAQIAVDAALGARAMSWQFTDPAANRQGMTIAEFGEPGGPGVGGCPNGPLQSGPPAPSNINATIINGGGAIQVDWTVPTPIPGTPAIQGYRLTAVGAEANGEKVELGKSITNPAATSTVISGFGANGVAAASTFDIEMVSLSTAGYTFPAAHALPATDTTAPVLAASQPTGSYANAFDLTLTSNDPAAQIYYTLNGPSPLDTSLGFAAPALDATLFTAPIHIAANTQVQVVAFDVFGNASAVTTLDYTITNQAAAGTPVVTSVTPGLADVTAVWTAAPVGELGATIVNYDVRVYDSLAAAIPVAHVEVAGNVLSASVPGLASVHQYWVSVAAKNSVNPIYGTESARQSVTTTGVTANAGADVLNVARPTAQVALHGTSAAPGASFAWTQVGDEQGLTAVAPGDVVAINGANTANPTVAIPAYTLTQTVGPKYFKLTVTGNGATAVDFVKIVPVVDPVGITTAKWKQNDFRVVGTGGIDGATVTLYAVKVTIVNGVSTTTYSQLGVATVAVGAWEVRLRTGLINPGVVIAISNRGGRTGNVTVV